MKRFTKNLLFLGLGAIFCVCFLTIYSSPAEALSTSIRQVKANSSPAVYYLYHAGHRKKVYLNADIYLNYGNKWPDVKPISTSDLDSWPDVKLIKTVNSPAVYYIRGNEKSLITKWSDIEDYSLSSEPIINVSQLELNYYKEVDNNEIGLKREPVELPVEVTAPVEIPVEKPIETPIASSAPAVVGNVLIYNDLVKGTNDNSILSGSKNNLLASFRFYSAEKVATITSITFDFSGIYSEEILSFASILDGNNAKYSDANVSLSQSRHQATINFRDPLTINPGAEKTVKVYLDLATGSFNNQTIHVELKTASNVVSNLTPTANFPLIGAGFKILDGSNVLGRTKSQEVSMAATQGVSVGSRSIGKFILSEESGIEEADIKNLSFLNNGTATVNDYEDFRLLNNGQIVSRTNAVNSDGFISFDIAYLRIKNGSPVTLTVTAALKTNRNKNATVDLQLYSASVVGKTYSSYLTTEINNIKESLVLN